MITNLQFHFGYPISKRHDMQTYYLKAIDVDGDADFWTLNEENAIKVFDQSSAEVLVKIILSKHRHFYLKN